MESQKINRIKVALVENGKTGKWLAAQVGKNEATVSRWCSNKMQPSLDTLVRISELLDIDVKRKFSYNFPYNKTFLIFALELSILDDRWS